MVIGRNSYFEGKNILLPMGRSLLGGLRGEITMHSETLFYEIRGYLYRVD
jgi:hypothetical protein